MKWTISGLSACGLAAALLLTPLRPSSASAAFTTCRTDPVVTLSNGDIVTLYTDTAADVTQISGVSYELHVPNGLSVNRVDYDNYGALENLKVVADRSGHHYSVFTTVTTNTATAASVTAHMDISGLRSRDVTGSSGQTISIYM